VRVDRLALLLAPWLGGAPAYAAVATGLRGLALDGRLPVGSRVPSERALAVALGLSRTTVTAAYDVLRGEGYLRSDYGAGSAVALPGARPAGPDDQPGDRPAVLDLSVAALPAPAALVHAVHEATHKLRPMLAGHGLHPLGVPALREAIADHLTGRGLRTTPDQVLVTAGALHGWNLVLTALGRVGSRVLVEQPTYPAVLDAVSAHRLRATPMPVGPAGWDLPVAPGGLVHLTPDGQNPTGFSATALQRRDLVRWATGGTLVVDETFADLTLNGRPVRPLGAFDQHAITLGSMSKAFWAGLRLGWVRAEPDLLRRLTQARGAQDLASPVLEQLVATELLHAAEGVLTERRAGLRASRDALIAALRDALPAWSFVRPHAGMVLWVDLGGLSSTRLAGHALDLGLRLTPGPRFTVDGTADGLLRLPFTLPVAQVPQLVELLKEAGARAGTRAVASRLPSRWTA